MMQLFLNYTFKAWYGDSNDALEATAANSDLIQFSVIEPGGNQVNWRGYSDLKCCSRDDDCDINAATATVEMKVPFTTSLYHSKALQPKQQLLGQAIGLMQQGNHERTLSYLTDIFAISIMHYVGGAAHLSSRVTDAKSFCLRILLMCCKLSQNECTTLTARKVVLVDLTSDETDEDRELPAHVGVRTRSMKAQQDNQRAAKKTETKKDDNDKENDAPPEEEVVYGIIGCDEEEEHERRLVDLTNALRWEARCLGRSYLGVEELQQLSAQHV